MQVESPGSYHKQGIQFIIWGKVKGAWVQASVWQHPSPDVIKYSNTLAKRARILRFDGSLDLKI
jgi:hypothetical protein